MKALTLKISALAALCLSASMASAIVRFNGLGSGDDFPGGLACDQTTGDTYVVGTSYRGAAYGLDRCLQKITPTGTVAWTRYFGGSMDDLGTDVLVTSTGNVYVTGAVRNASGNYDIVVRRYNTGGGLLGSATHAPGTADDIGTHLCQDAAGNIYAVGTSQNLMSATSGDDMAIVSYTSTLGFRWSGVFGGTYGPDRPRSVAVGTNGLYIAGTGTTSGGDTNGVVARFSRSTGGYLGMYTVTGSVLLNDSVESVAIDSAGAVYMAATQNTTATGEQMVAIKAPANLAGTGWALPYNGTVGTQSDQAKKIVVSAGYVVMAGSTQTAAGHYDYATLRMDATTGLLTPGFPTTFHYMDGDLVRDAAVDTAGNIFVAGYSDGPTHDYCWLKYSSGGGLLLGPVRYHYSNQDEPIEIGLDGAMNLTLTGASEGVSFDWASGKWNGSTGTAIW